MDEPGVDGKSFVIEMTGPWKFDLNEPVFTREEKIFVVEKIYYNWWRKILSKLGFRTKLLKLKVKEQ